jgi:large subunit ribosomal protein L14
MKALKARITRCLPVGARVKVADNSGAKVIEIIAVKGYKGRRGRIASAGVGDLVVATVKEGGPELKHKLVYAVIIRQKKKYRRPSGLRVYFEDNAAVLLKDLATLDPKGTAIKGPVAREAVRRFPSIGRIASMVI